MRTAEVSTSQERWRRSVSLQTFRLSLTLLILTIEPGMMDRGERSAGEHDREYRNVSRHGLAEIGRV